MVLTTFPFLQFLHNFDFLIKKQESCSNHWWEPFFHHPKITKIHNNKIFMFDATDVFAREVLQKSIFALPCCMGSFFCFASHAAWECDFCCSQHLSSENAIFNFFLTPPQRESPKWRKSHFEAMLWRRQRGKCNFKNRQQICVLPRYLRSGHVFQLHKKTYKSIQ